MVEETSRFGVKELHVEIIVLNVLNMNTGRKVNIQYIANTQIFWENVRSFLNRINYIYHNFQ